jgi:RNA polymerase sigma-70 factor (ECF subfamily)
VIETDRRPHHEEMSLAAIRHAPASAPDVARGRQAAAVDQRLRQILDENFTFIWRSLRRLGLTNDQADDAAQQVFVVASRRIDAIQLGSERSFLLGTAIRVASDVRRSAAYRREIVHPDPGAELEGGVRPDELLEHHRARAALDGVLEEMELDLRTVFILYELEEMTTGEIATLLAIPSGTVASRLRRAREDFQARVARLQAAPPKRGGTR